MSPSRRRYLVDPSPENRNRTVLVLDETGGMGRMAALALARAGAAVVAVGRDRTRGEALVSEVSAQGGRAEFIAADLSSMAAVQTAAATLTAGKRPVDAVLCNAAIPDWRPSSRGRTDEGLNRIFATSFLSHDLFVRLVLPDLEAREGASSSWPGRSASIVARLGSTISGMSARARSVPLMPAPRSPASVS